MSHYTVRFSCVGGKINSFYCVGAGAAGRETHPFAGRRKSQLSAATWPD